MCEGIGSVTVCVEVTGESVVDCEFSISTAETGTATGNIS